MPEISNRNRPDNSDQSRGRRSKSPAAIPAPGWKDIAWRVYNEVSDDRIMLTAAGITFYLLLAMVPALTAIVSIFSLFADPAVIQKQIQLLDAAIPGGAIEIIDDQLNRLVQQDQAALGFAFVISLCLAIWSTNAGVKALFEGMNVAYDEREGRSFLALTLTSLVFTFVTVLAALIAVASMIVLPVALSLVGLEENVEWLIRISGALLLVGLLSLAIAALYRWGPSRDDAKWVWITPGCVTATVVIVATSVGFSFYVANFGSYNATYGSLGAVIGFMTWIWISTTIVILGAELNAEIEHQTMSDTTTGEHQPLGSRGAAMADHVGMSVSGDSPGPILDNRKHRQTGGGSHHRIQETPISPGRNRSARDAADKAWLIPVIIGLVWMAGTNRQ